MATREMRKAFLRRMKRLRRSCRGYTDEYLSGKGYAELARELNGEGIPSPKQHKINKGILHGEKGETCFWLPTTLQQILRNEIYTGVLTSGAYEHGPLGSGKRVFVPEEERVRVKNAHPAIIERDTFREVQERMEKKKHGEAQQIFTERACTVRGMRAAYGKG